MKVGAPAEYQAAQAAEFGTVRVPNSPPQVPTAAPDEPYRYFKALIESLNLAGAGHERVHEAAQTPNENAVTIKTMVALKRAAFFYQKAANAVAEYSESKDDLTRQSARAIYAAYATITELDRQIVRLQEQTIDTNATNPATVRLGGLMEHMADLIAKEDATWEQLALLMAASTGVFVKFEADGSPTRRFRITASTSVRHSSTTSTVSSGPR